MILFHVGVPLAAFLAHASLLYLLYRSGFTSTPRKVLAVFLLANCFAALSSFTLHTNLLGNPTTSLWCLMSSGGLLYASLVHFAALFPSRKPRAARVVPFVYLLVPAILVPLFATGLAIDDVQYVGGGLVSIDFGPLMNLAFAFILACGALAAAFLVSSLRHARGEVERWRVQYTLAASLCLPAGGLINAIPPLSGYPFDIAFQVIAALLLSYAVLRHRLLGIGTIMKERAAHALVFFTVLLLYLTLLLTLVSVPQLGGLAVYGAIGTLAAIMIAWLYYRFGDAVIHALRAKFLDIQYDHTDVLEQATRLCSRPGNPRDLAKALVDLIRQHIRCSNAGLWLYDPDTGRYVLAASAGLDDLRREELLLDDSHPFVARLHSLHRVMPPAEMEQFRTVPTSLEPATSVPDKLDADTAVPLEGIDGMLGFIILGPKDSGSYSPEDLALLEGLRHQAAVALDNARFHRRLRSLASQLSLAEERERKRLAVEVHDQICQPLAALKLKLAALRQPLASAGIPEEVDTIQHLVDQAITDARSLTFDLSPPLLYEMGLEAALEWLSEEYHERHGLACTITDDGQPKPLGDDGRALLFSSARELLMNVVKHAQTDRAELSVWRDAEYVRVRVSDDGVGFDTSRSRGAAQTFGLFSIRQRLADFGGQMELESIPGRGTRVTVAVPVKQGSEPPTETDDRLSRAADADRSPSCGDTNRISRRDLPGT